MKHPIRNFLPRTVVIFGLVSFLNDAASEMITPLLPIFLTAALGAGPAIVGLVEGFAEATASILKLVSGRMADRGWKPKRLVIAGYGLSNSTRPLIGLALGWFGVLALRFLDRAGKGLRTSPRDALIASSVAPDVRGRAFGFQRALDHAGAVVGPLLAFALLSHGNDLRHVFLMSVVPGVVVILLLWFGLPDTPGTDIAEQKSTAIGWHELDSRLRAVIVSSGGLALATTPEVFLVLWAEAHGLEIVWVPLLWAAASGVKLIVAIPGGYLSDRFGRLPNLLTGWGLRVLILVGLGLTETTGPGIWLLFLSYAGSLALTEASERALIGDNAPAGIKATAFGLYHMTAGLLALPGAVLFGTLWQSFGETVAFLSAAGLTTISVAVLLGIIFLARNTAGPVA